ncbi:MAG: trigger factor [Novosphingobium sp.]|nr:trigger factor [Novosphingobium sp.]
MQIAETASEGLKRAYAVTIPAKEISARVEGEVRKIAPQVRMPGFRPGKVPANLVRKMHGAALHQDALNTAIREAMDKLVRDNKLRPAMQPEVELGDGYKEGQDAKLAVSLEVLPDIASPDISGLRLEKLTVPVSEVEVDEAVQRIASGQKSFVAAKKGKKAETGDQLVIDFLGKLDGEPFEGGAGTDTPLELGAGRFIPGFEEQLVGLQAGDDKTITVTFPADYPAGNLKGREATFDVSVKEVKIAGEAKLDDDLAKSLGLESLEQLRGLLKGQLEQETAGLTRTQMKRALLDQLAADHDFEVPPSMVEAEFEQIWQQLLAEADNEDDPAAARAEIEREKDDYRAIAVRRVRLGLLLSEIGQANGVQVSPQEMEMLITQAARQYREEDRDRFVQFIRSNALAAAQLRAPLYEDKVVDFLFDKAEVSEREATRDELQAAIEAEEAAPPPAKPAAKKAAVKEKKLAAKKSDKAEPAAAPATKPAAKKVAEPAAKPAKAETAKPKPAARPAKEAAPTKRASAKKA